MRRRGLSPSLRFEVLKRDGFACGYCGRKPPEVVLHCDHVVPVSRGGSNDMDNLRTACRDCNLGKGARRLDDRSRIERQLDLIPAGAHEPPADSVRRRVLYIQGILRNRFGDRRLDCVGALRARLARGVPLDAMERAAKRARDWAGFDASMRGLSVPRENRTGVSAAPD